MFADAERRLTLHRQAAQLLQLYRRLLSGQAVRADGTATWSNDPEAVGFCAGGAILRAYGYAHCGEPAYRAAVACGCETVMDFNDAPGRTKEQVIELLKRADV